MNDLFTKFEEDDEETGEANPEVDDDVMPDDEDPVCVSSCSKLAPRSVQTEAYL